MLDSVRFEVRRFEARGFEDGEQVAGAVHRRQARLDRATLATEAIMESTREAPARGRPLVVNQARDVLSGARGCPHERAAWLLEPCAGGDHPEAILLGGDHLVGLERDAPEERPIAAEPARLAEALEVASRRRWSYLGHTLV
jgi:hypothetical protein